MASVHPDGANGWRAQLCTATAELIEILSIKPFLFATLGAAASAFAGGGMADWLTVFVIR